MLFALAPLAAVFFLQDPATPTPTPAADAPVRVRALIIEQEANGLPNQPTEERVLQRLIVAADRLCLEDPTSGVATVLRLDRDPPTMLEISTDRAHYREGRPLDQIQRDRDRQERQTLEKLDGRPAKERESVMADLHLRPGLAREVTVERPAEEREILGRKAERVIVRENGRVVVDAWISAEDFGIPFFEFYRRVGAFSQAVLDALRAVEGLPLEVDFTVVTATLAHKIEVRARSLKVEEVPAWVFEVPAGAVKIEESPFAACPICGREVEKAAPPAGMSTRRDGTEVFFDRRECKVEYNRREWPERFGPKHERE
jgi:hypothetical protein